MTRRAGAVKIYALVTALLLIVLTVLPVYAAQSPEPSEDGIEKDESYLTIMRASFGIAAVLICGCLYIRRRKGYEPILQKRRRRR